MTRRLLISLSLVCRPPWARLALWHNQASPFTAGRDFGVEQNPFGVARRLSRASEQATTGSAARAIAKTPLIALSTDSKTRHEKLYFWTSLATSQPRCSSASSRALS